MSGITITADSGTEFTANAAEWNSVCRLDDNNYAVAYRDNNDGNKGKVNVGSRTGTSVTINEANAVIFNNDSTDMITVRAMSATLIIISYRDVNSNRGYVIAATISGTTITLGTAVQVVNANIDGISVAPLDATNFVVSKSLTNGGTGGSYVGSISGTTITLGTLQAQTVNGVVGNFGYINNSPLDSTHFVSVCVYGAIYAQVGTVNTGNKTITYGTAKDIDPNSPADKSRIINFDNQHFIVAMPVSSSSIRIVACSINPSTLVITHGSAMSDISNASHPSICAITTNNFIVSYYTTTGTQAEVRSGTLTGDTTIAWDAQGAVILDNGTSSYIALCRLTDSYFIVGYKSG